MQLNEHVYSVGVLNPTMRIFDIIMTTGYGTSYNAYVVKGSEKTALIETAHESYAGVFFDHLTAVTAPEDIDYLIMNHTEPDHSGSVRRLLELNPNIVIYGTTATLKNLEAITQMTFNSVTVKDHDTLSLGDRTLEFLISPNVHWPDTMMTWLVEDQMLFSCDFLGAHFAEPTMYADTVRHKELYDQEFLNYYNAIMSPFAGFVRKALAKIADLDIALVCPSHGPLLRGNDINIAKERYQTWSQPQSGTQKSVAIYYVSAYGYTGSMAKYLAEQLEKANLDVFICDVIRTDAAVVAEHLEADLLVFGSPTINRAALKPIWDTISTIDAVTAQNKPFATLGCYGWSGEACEQLNARLAGIKMKQVGESVRSRFTPTAETYQALDTLSKQIIEKLQA